MVNYLAKIFNWIGLFRVAFSRYKKAILLLTLLGFISGILGGVGIGAVIPLFSFVSGQEVLVDSDPISKLFRVTFDFLGLNFSLSVVIIALIFIFVLKALFLYVGNVIKAKIAADYERETRIGPFKYTISANWPYLLDRKIGYLSQMMTEDVRSSAAILISIGMIILFLTNLITYMAVAMTISAPTTIITIMIGIGMFFALKPLFYKIRKMSEKYVYLSKELSHYVNQYLLGVKTVKSLSIEQEVTDRARGYFKELSLAQLSMAKYNNVLSNFLEPLTLAVIIPIFLVSYKNPAFNIASFAAILYLVQKMFSFVQSIQIRISQINQDIPHLVDVISYQSDAMKQKEEINSGKIPKFESELNFDGVDFYYREGEEKILNDLSFKIKKGEMVGLIGSSGSGKTTIIDLILKLFNPTGRIISVDNMNLTELNMHKWRRKIGYVSQEMFLLNDTITENIRFYDNNVTEADIRLAVKLANIEDFIKERPEGFNAVVGERGLKLSAGQRQRIILARILARNPEILILDEATSALDNESELAIQKALENLRGKVTMLIVAHRLSTIVNSDRIIVIEAGKILEEGLPQELLNNKNSYFRRVYNVRDN